MLRIYQLLITFGTITVLVLLAGCGPNTSTGATSLPTTTIGPSTTATSASTQAVRTGPVTLHTDAPFYRTGDTISVILSNQSSQTIYFPDHLTNCTVILLQRQKVQPLAGENGQAGINPCRLGIATRIHSLDAGQRLVVRLVAPFNGWLTGFYRATLSYRTPLNAGPSTTIYSAAFTVGPLVPQEPSLRP
jgi:hypothetical protein